MADDPSTQQVVLFGGYSGGFSLGDTWTWDGYSWTQQLPAHVPPARDTEQMAFDAQTGQLLMFGGHQAGIGGLADTWVWTGTDWIQLTPPTSPPNRNEAALAMTR